MADEDKVLSALFMDRSPPLGNTEDVFGRRALHTKIGNKASEPVPVYVTSSNVTGLTRYNAVTAVPASVETTVLTYLVPASTIHYLERCQVSGTNIAQYKVKIDGTVVEQLYTWFNGPMTDRFDFSSGNNRGLKLVAGQIITVTVTHLRPFVGDFNARIQSTEEPV